MPTIIDRLNQFRLAAVLQGLDPANVTVALNEFDYSALLKSNVPLGCDGCGQTKFLDFIITEVNGN